MLPKLCVPPSPRQASSAQLERSLYTPALLISTSIGRSFSFAASAFTSVMLATSMRSTRTLGCSATRAVSDSGISERRCVAITVQPLAAYCFANSRPSPEFAPVMSTVSARAAGSCASQQRSTVAAMCGVEGRAIVVSPRARVLKTDTNLKLGADSRTSFVALQRRKKRRPLLGRRSSVRSASY